MTIPKPLRSLLLLAFAGSGLMFFSGCEGDVVYNDRPAYYGGGGDDVDFYYVSGRPYSRHYGELIVRDGGYYYNHGGSYVVYDRGSARHDYHGGDRYRTDHSYGHSYGRTDYQRVENERNYRNTTVNNYSVTNPGARSRNAPVTGQATNLRGGGYQGERNPYVRTQIRGAQPVQGQPGQYSQQHSDKKKKVKTVTY